MSLLVAIALVTFSIFIHELGHFLVARWRKLVVPRFSIFGIGRPIISRKWRGVEYCICWLPIGAYVMIPQLADLGEFEGELPAEVPKKLPPADYTSKVLTALAGPAANLLFALILASVVWFVGMRVPVEFNRTEVGDIAARLDTTDNRTVPGPAAAAGLQVGDVIREIDGVPVSDFEGILREIAFGARVAPDGRRVATISFDRDGRRLSREVYPELTGSEGFRSIGISPRSDLVVEQVFANSAASEAGILVGDRIIAVDGKPLARREELGEHFQQKIAQPSVLTLRRGTETTTTSILPRRETDPSGKPVYRIGIQWRIETVLIHPNPLAQIGDICHQMYQTIVSLLNRNSDIRLKHMQSIVGMVGELKDAASSGVVPTLLLLILINVALATFNLLPIPVLDGGHVAIATYTKIRGRPINPVWLQNMVALCFVMLISLIVYVTYHDIRRQVGRGNEEAPPKAAPAQPAK